MINKYTSLCEIMAENPMTANILLSYGIPAYAIIENQSLSLDEMMAKYDIDSSSVVNQINNGLVNLY